MANSSFHTISGSIRFHNTPSASWSLAARIVTPVLLAALIAFVAFAYVVQMQIREFQFADVGGRAYPVARTIAKFGRVMLNWRNHFLEEHPGYDIAQEWPVHEHWLVTGGFIGVNKFALLAGVPADGNASVIQLERALEKAALLSIATMGLDDPESLGDEDMVAAYILDLERRAIASNRDISSVSNFDSPEWRRLPTPTERRQVRQNDAWPPGVYVDQVTGRGTAPMLRMILPIVRNGLSEEEMGTAIVVFRTDRIQYEQRSFLIFTIVAVLCLLAFVGAVCWYATRRAIAPLRRLAADMHALADGDLTRRSAITGSDEVGLVAQSFNAMAERLRLARLNEKEASRLESDLAVARQIQNNLLPAQTPQIRGLDVFTSYRSAREIGGDYYDFLPVDNRHMGIIVADASGKSIPAALVMSSTRAVLRFVAPGATSAAETLSRVNAILSVDIPRGMFVTACYAILDPLDSSMMVASAGHNPLLVSRGDDTVELVNPGGIALGFDQGPIFQRSIREQRVKLRTGDRVLIYTDGVVECKNPQNEEYSDRRLREFLRRNRNLSSYDFVGALVADLDRHRGAAEVSDDTTIVTFKVL